MLSTVNLAIFSAALLAMVGAIFGVCIARLVWADDLRATKALKVHWDGSQYAMEKTIAALHSTINSQDQIIAIQKRRLGE